MYLLEKISNNLAEGIAAEMSYDQDRKEVIAYGAYAIMQIGLSILMVVLFGILFGVAAEALVVSLSGAWLRRYTGGAHASSPNICIIVGTVACIGFALLSRLTLFTNVRVTGTLVLVVHTAAFGLIHRLAPVASENKPIPEKKRPGLKRGGMVTNTVYLLVSAGTIAAAIFLKKSELLAYPVCMALGVFWQIFSMTHVGEVCLRALDRLLSFKRTTTD